MPGWSSITWKSACRSSRSSRTRVTAVTHAGEQLPVGGDIYLAGVDHVHAIAEIPFAHDRCPGLVPLLPHDTRQLTQLAGRESRKQIQAAEVEDDLDPVEHANPKATIACAIISRIPPR